MLLTEVHQPFIESTPLRNYTTAENIQNFELF